MTSPPSTEGLIERTRIGLGHDASHGEVTDGRKAFDELLKEISIALTPPTPGPPDDVLVAAARKALNFIENTEGELGIELDSGIALREALARFTQPKGDD